MKDWKITVMGDWERDESLLAKADVIAGGTRLLDSLPASYRAERVALDVHLLERIRDLLRRAERENVVILASGDPLYHGIGGTIAKLAGREHLRVLPCVTAFQRLFAALGRPWNGASLFSLHGVEENLPWRRILNASTAIVYGDHRRTASDIAAQLISCFQESASRSAAIGSELGTEQEKVCSGTLAEMASMNAPALSVLALFPAEVTPGIPLGLPDEKYEHQNRMITHPEVRAVVLSKLRLRSGVLWDLGAAVCSGIWGREAALLELRRQDFVRSLPFFPWRRIPVGRNRFGKMRRNKVLILFKSLKMKLLMRLVNSRILTGFSLGADRRIWNRHFSG